MLVSALWLHKVVYVLGLALFFAACVSGLGYEIATERRLPTAHVDHYVKADGHLRKREYENAIAEYRRGTKIRPDLIHGFIGLARALDESGDADGQLQTFKNLVAVRPRAKMGHLRLAEIYEKMGRLDEAVAHYRVLARAEPHSGDVRYNLGVVLLKSKQYDEAAREIMRTLPLLPGDPRVYNNLGVALIHQKKSELAIDSFAAAVRLDPENVHYLANLRAAVGARVSAPAEGPPETP